MRTAVVTGGGSGIGKAVAARLRKDGYQVAVFDIAPSGGELEYKVDVTDRARVDADWGRIVNISSSSTHSGQPFMSSYVAAKSGVNGLTKSLALEYGPQGITVNAVPPGFVNTPMLRRAEGKGLLGGTIEEHIERTPVRRAGRPEDIAAACSFLIGEEAGYITGQILGVNGGRNT
ncbi:SDR family oxidoreductase [Rhodococcus sp. F64268]|uniref:SDR family NAD(P)-dependent oxidoreductase n=1 Tax=Rhodococcus sp. F64268 TaxID=2926402 RepID=UPI001FF487A8|nr:SDR family oxidoreductase [Rhodococcus sp. F64268]MCK0092612.1 SDR family oxidoreductase [Rhodococcus sp. F64268]